MKKNNLKKVAVPLVSASLLLGGCASNVAKLDNGSILLTKADERIVIRTPDGHICAEPSPDVFGVDGKSFLVGASAGIAGLPKDVSPEVAAAIALNSAQSAAQLGERMATIQLLRDGLFRACEAYASGALTQASYAVLLSRYDDTMVSLLSTEVAGGAYGRSLASLSSNASGNASASLEHHSTLKESREALDEYKDELKHHDELKQKLVRTYLKENQLTKQISDLSSDSTTPVANNLQTYAKLQTELDQTRDELAELETMREQSTKWVYEAEKSLDRTLSSTAQGQAAATSVAAGSIQVGEQKKEVAEIIEEIQKNYVENINSDAMDVACITAIEQDADKGLGKYCVDIAFHEKSKALKMDIMDKVMGYRKLKVKEETQVKLAVAQTEIKKLSVQEKEAEAKVLTAKLELAKLTAKKPSGDAKPATPVSKVPDSNEVKWLQLALNMINNEGLVVDGVMGKETEAAIMRFQRDNALKVDGSFGENTRAKLFDILAKPKTQKVATN